MKDLEGRVAVVTGAASGIGLALAERLLRERMKVVVADVDAPRLAEEAQRLARAGGEVLAVPCDVRDAAAVASLAERTLAHFGAAHVAINNAGVVPIGPLLETTPADWRWALDVNLLGVVHGSIEFGRIFRAAGDGHIVNTASEVGHMTMPSYGLYSATKHAVVAFSETLHRELAGTGVGVSCLCPGTVRTRFPDFARSRDDGVALSEGQRAAVASLEQRVAAFGIAPADAAGPVVEAIRDGRFWVFTHTETPGRATARARDIEAGRNPTDPFA